MAYAAAVSLWNNLMRLQLSDDPFSKSQIKILLEGVDSLIYFLEVNREVKRDFEIQIRDTIYEAQDIIDFHISAHFLSPSESEISSQSFCRDLDRVIQKINSLAGMAESEEFNHQTLDRKISNSVWKKSGINCRKKYPIVGRDEDLIQLKDRLISGSEGLQVIPIVGIAGIGKTALARCVYTKPWIKEQFEISAWVKVPVEYKKRDVLSGLLRSMKKLGDEIRQRTDEHLAKYLSNSLKGERYLIVLDDIRDVAVWNDLKELFPDYSDGSRILLTTRNMDVAPAPPHRLDRLSDADTSFLLRKIVFCDQRCRQRLAVIAKNIAKSCRGLPHAVVIVGRLLLSAKLPHKLTANYWNIANYWKVVLSSINTCENYVDLIEALVSLTYKHLPQQLKACVLYMAMFPYDYEITTQKLLDIWIAERFIGKGNLEEIDIVNIVTDSLVDLMGRGLVSYREKTGGSYTGCRIDEEVFHDFILRKAKEEKFFLVINKGTNYGFLQENTTSTYNQQRRLCIYKNIRYVIKDLSEYNYSSTSISTVRSLHYMGPEYPYPLRTWLDFKLLSTLDALKIRFYTFPPEIFKLIHLRHLAFSYNGQLPAAICQLQNLQFLIVLSYLSVKCSGAPSYLPVEIWNMKELWHLQVMGRDLSDIPSDTDLHLENLSRLIDVSSHSCTPRILKRLRNLARLEIQIESSSEDESLSFFSHLDILDNLQIFKCVVMYPDIGSQFVPSSIPTFPSTLRRLNLKGCGFPWEYMRVIAALPNLEMLKLRSYAFRGPKWEVKTDEFSKLKFLMLEDMDVENWILTPDGSSFPKLKYLIIRHCYKLQEIPLGFADGFNKLETIEVVDCSTSSMNSALQINEKKLSRRYVPAQFDFYSSLND